MQPECPHTVRVVRKDRVLGWVRVCDVCGDAVPLVAPRGLLGEFTAPTGPPLLWAGHGKPQAKLGKES